MSIGYASTKNADPKSIVPPTSILLSDDSVNTWVRPAEWLELPTVLPTDQKLVGLVGVSNNTGQFLAFNCVVNSGTYTVDWGDGSIENIASSGQANHQYVYDNITSPLTSIGDKQVIVQIYPTTPGATFTNINTQVKYNIQLTVPTGTLNTYSTGFLDMVISSPTAGSITVGGTTVFHAKMEQFKLLNSGGVGGFSVSTCYALESVSINFGTSAYAVSMQDMFRQCVALKVAPSIQWEKCTNAFQMFSGCNNLRYVPDSNTAMPSMGSANGVTRFMFADCYALKKAPFLRLENSTATDNMFQNCSSLVDVPAYDLSRSTNCSTMFSVCYSLTYCPPFKTSTLLASTATMFANCWSLRTVAGFLTDNVANMSNMFQNCYSLEDVPLFNTQNVTTMALMFAGCNKLRNVPFFNTIKVIFMNGTFSECRSLTTVPLFNTNNVTSMSSTFSSSSLYDVPLFNTTKVTNMATMFQNNRNIQNVPLFNTANVTSMNGMFNYCLALNSCPTFNTANVTDMGAMFSDSGIVEAPNFNTIKVIRMDGMFQSVRGLLTIPLYDTANVTNMNAMFNNAQSLQKLPLLNTSKVTDFSSFLNAAKGLEEIPAMNWANATSIGTFVNTNNSIGKMLSTGMNVTLSVASQKMGKPELELLFKNLGSGSAARTITISGNWGADTSVSKSTTWGDSKTISVPNTTGLFVGMTLTATNMSLAQNCNFFDTTNEVVVSSNKNIINGTEVGFTSVVTTTGITSNTLYYVVNSTGDRFQVALTPGGTPINLVTNGTGTVRWGVHVIAIDTIGNTVTVDNTPGGVQASAGALVFRVLNTNYAAFKNWTISG